MVNHITNWFQNKQASLVKGSIAVFFLLVIIDPSNQIFHAKYIVFSGVFLLWLPTLMGRAISLARSQQKLLLFVSFFMPFYAISLGMLKHFLSNTTMGDVLYFNSFFFFLIYAIVQIDNIRLTKIFNTSTLLILLVTGISYLVLLYDPTSFGKLYTYFVVDKNVAVYALRKYGDFTLLMMFYKTSPLLVFPLSYLLYQLFIKNNKKKLVRNSLLLVAIVVCLFLSGTRANIVSLAFILLFYLLFYAYKNSKPIFLLIAIVYLLLLFFSASFIGNILLSKSEVSNSIKLGHLLSYIEHFENNFSVLLFGQGLGGSFYTSGLHQTVAVSELSYFELIRIWGLPIAILFGIILLIPLYEEIKRGKISYLFIAYLAYLFIAGTNPLLLSSTGMLVLVYVFSELEHVKAV